MMIKWVVCSVPVSERTAFAKRQRAWKQFTHTKGFMGRIGGWNIKNPLEANMITFWQDRAAYQSFIRKQGAAELETYPSIEHFTLIDSHVYQKTIDIFGLTHQQVFASLSACGHLLKIGDCQVNAASKEHFLLMQQSVWNLGMANTPGMTTGLFSESLEAADRFLILTRWKNEEEYKAYEEHILPKLLNWAYDGQVDEQFQGRLIDLEPDWYVAADKNK